MVEKALLGIVLFPLFGAITNGLFGRKASRATVHAISIASVACAFGLSLWAFGHLLQARLGGHEHAVLRYTAYEWFSLTLNHRTLSIPVRFVMDALSGIMALVVTGISLLIHIYATGYMSEEPSYARFFSYLNLFTAAMLILVLGSSLPIMFVGWEGVGLCSYLLIGFWFENADYAAAGRKAFVTNRIGDFGVLIGMFLLAVATHSLEFADINAFALRHPGQLMADLALGPQNAPFLVISGVSMATAATMFLFLGCTGKSAQLPLFVWLPDAMAGPTPVSALIHAATMVTSGIYLLCRLSPVFVLAPHTMAVIAVVGALTALMAASVGLVQNDIKKVLAYSTVSQLGFMFAAAGCGAFAAGFMHVFTHAFFKACLFLGAGSVMHAVGAHGDADIRTLGGLRKYMPWTRGTFLVSCLAIAGVPFFSGFFSKDEILVGVLSSQAYFSFAPWLPKAVFASLVLGATMTAFYMFRLYFLTFSGEYRGGPAHEPEPANLHDDPDEQAAHAHAHAHRTPHESPSSMTVPLVVLGAGALLAGYVWVGIAHFEPWVTWLEPALGSIHAEHAPGTPLIAMAFGMSAAAVGIGLAYLWYFRSSTVPALLASRFRGLHQLLLDKWRIDELYDNTILAASRGIAWLCARFDSVVVDGLTTKVTVQLVVGTSWLFTRIQTGLVHTYGAVMAVGLLAVVFHFMVPHAGPEMVGEPVGMKVSFSANRGLGYQYRWDYDGDGEFDSEWTTDAASEHEFRDAELKGFAVVVESAAYAAQPRTFIVKAGEQLHVRTGALSKVVSRGELGVDEFGDGWRLSHNDKNAGLPTIVGDEHGIVIKPHGAKVRKAGRLEAPDADVHVARGEHVTIGEARVSVSGMAKPKLSVRNAFGMESAETLSIVLPKVTPRISAQVASAARSAGPMTADVVTAKGVTP